MTAPGGYFGRFLVVDVTDGSTRTEPLPEQVLRDYVGGDGRAGYFQNEHLVYGRAGEPCYTCGTPIREIRQGQRATFYCPVCQRR